MRLGNPIIYIVDEVELEEVKQPWYPKPIERKVLRRDPVTGALHVLVKYPPDLNAPAHRHNCGHTIFILRGEMAINGKTYPEGTYCYFPPGETMIHTSSADRECTFLIFFEKSPEFIVEGGETYKI